MQKVFSTVPGRNKLPVRILQSQRNIYDTSPYQLTVNYTLLQLFRYIIKRQLGHSFACLLPGSFYYLCVTFPGLSWNWPLSSIKHCFWLSFSLWLMGDTDGDWHAGNREKLGHCSLSLQQQQQLHLLHDSSFQPLPLQVPVLSTQPSNFKLHQFQLQPDIPSPYLWSHSCLPSALDP